MKKHLYVLLILIAPLKFAHSFEVIFFDSEQETLETQDIPTPTQTQVPEQNPYPSSNYRWPAPAYRPYSKEWVSQEIEKGIKASITKDGAFCKLEAINTKGESFVASFSTGIGNNMSYGAGNGTVIVNPSQPVSPQPYIGLTVTFTKTNCTQTVLVPVIDYRVFASFKSSLLDENGQPVRTLTPAQQTMLLYYATLAKQVTGCQQNTAR